MAAYTCVRKSDQTWAEVLSASPRKSFRFFITSIGIGGEEIRIRNTDGTFTVLAGRNLETTVRRGETKMAEASLTGGTIIEMSRLGEDGAILESISGLDVLAGGPSSKTSFSRPPGELASLDWVMSQISIGTAALLAAQSDTFHSDISHDALSRGEPQLPPCEMSDVGDTCPHSGGTPGASRTWLTPLLTIAASTAVGFMTVLIAWQTTDNIENDPLKARFVRPHTIPSPADNVPTPSRIALGKRLFNETRISSDGSVSCATCHDPERAFTDGNRYSKGVSGKPLRRHSPTLWNVAWGQAFFWDGREPSLEKQSLKPIQDPDEMGLPIAEAVTRLRSDPTYIAGFAAAFPEQPTINADTLSKALASYQRSLVAPPTRFDRWIAGDRKALTAQEQAGFAIFNGTANCASCHSGWAFTDHGFHDVGLADTDKGRGAVMGIARLDHAFKTPSLRELKWTSPYMHDGSLATLDDVVTHYENGVIDRPSLSRDLPRKLDLTADERTALLAFLGSLSSDATPKPLINIEVARSRNTVAGSAVSKLKTIGQKEKCFAPEHVRVGLGESLVIVNNDNRPHNVSIAHPRMGFSSGMQDPGDEVKLEFPEEGKYEIFCGVHPNMRLMVEVLTAALRK